MLCSSRCDTLLIVAGVEGVTFDVLDAIVGDDGALLTLASLCAFFGGKGGGAKTSSGVCGGGGSGRFVDLAAVSVNDVSTRMSFDGGVSCTSAASPHSCGDAAADDDVSTTIGDARADDIADIGVRDAEGASSF